MKNLIVLFNFVFTVWYILLFVYSLVYFIVCLISGTFIFVYYLFRFSYRSVRKVWPLFILRYTHRAYINHCSQEPSQLQNSRAFSRVVCRVRSVPRTQVSI